MKEQQWICFQEKTARQKQDWYNKYTLSYTRRNSISALLGNSSMTWAEAQGYGWKCIKVKVTIEPR